MGGSYIVELDVLGALVYCHTQQKHICYMGCIIVF